jgi:hypothetical protein
MGETNLALQAYLSEPRGPSGPSRQLWSLRPISVNLTERAWKKAF